MNAESAAQFLPLIMIVLMMAAMYFLVFWPQRKREKKTKAMLAAIKVGDKVMTIGGVIGKVSAIKDDIITIEDNELVSAFLDMTETHKMIVENAGLLTVAALYHLDCKNQNVVPILTGGNMDIITMSSLIQNGLINRGRVFTFSVQLPDRPGELLQVASIVAKERGNIIKLEHNQFVNINRQHGVELRVTLEAFGHDHKNAILTAMAEAGYQVKEVATVL